AAGGLLGARHYVNICRDRSILYVRWRVAVPIALFDATIFESDGSLGHQLRDAKSYSTLHLALDRQRIHCQPWVYSDCRAMDSGTSALNGNLNCASHSCAKALVTSKYHSAVAGNAFAPRICFLPQKRQTRSKFLRVGREKIQP